MNEIKIYPIGKIKNKEGSVCVKLDPMKKAETLTGKLSSIFRRLKLWR